jgi:anhydro-N-acetylmuramic acid kinase
VQAVCRIIPHLPRVPKAWIIAGGGARNRTLMKILKQRLSPVTVETANDAGWSADALEAQATLRSARSMSCRLLPPRRRVHRSR